MAGVVSAVSTLYSRKSGIQQELLFRQARQGWQDLQEDTPRNVRHGETKYEYLKNLATEMTGQALRVLNEFVDSWDHRNPDNIYYEEALTREVVRDVWRKYYRALALHDMKCSNMPNPGIAPVRPDLRPKPVEEPEELEEFLQMLAETFQASQATYLDDLMTFSAIPGEGVLETATRFDNMAIPLLNANLITERYLAFILRKHLPVVLRSKVFAKMDAQDDKRRIRGQETTTRHEMVAIA